MRITVKVKDVEIMVDESDSSYKAAIRYSDQNIEVQKLIKTMAEECLKLLRR